MRKVALAFTTALSVSAVTGVLAQNSGFQPTYDALMAMSADERQQALRAMDREALLVLTQMHLDEQRNIRTFRFAGLRENQGVSDATFVFTIPPSAEVRR